MQQPTDTFLVTLDFKYSDSVVFNSINWNEIEDKQAVLNDLYDRIKKDLQLNCIPDSINYHMQEMIEEGKLLLNKVT
jgi:hypothetical protein